MKTFILKAVERLRNYSQKLDAKAILFEKSWEVFNETGDKELMIFRTNSELLISRNGIVQKGKWELLDIANLLIDVDNKSYLLNAAYIEEKFLALKLDGTQQFMVMIETDMKNRFSMNSINAIEQYLEDRYKRIEAEKAEQKRLEEQKRKQLEAAIAEQRRREAIRQSEIERELVMKERSEAQRRREQAQMEVQKAEEEREYQEKARERYEGYRKEWLRKGAVKDYILQKFGRIFIFIFCIVSPIVFVILSLFTPLLNDIYSGNNIESLSVLIFIPVYFIFYFIGEDEYDQAMQNYEDYKEYKKNGEYD